MSPGPKQQLPTVSTITRRVKRLHPFWLKQEGLSHPSDLTRSLRSGYHKCLLPADQVLLPAGLLPLASQQVTTSETATSLTRVFPSDELREAESSWKSCKTTDNKRFHSAFLSPVPRGWMQSLFHRRSPCQIKNPGINQFDTRKSQFSQEIPSE